MNILHEYKLNNTALKFDISLGRALSRGEDDSWRRGNPSDVTRMRNSNYWYTQADIASYSY